MYLLRTVYNLYSLLHLVITYGATQDPRSQGYRKRTGTVQCPFCGVAGTVWVTGHIVAPRVL